MFGTRHIKQLSLNILGINAHRVIDMSSGLSEESIEKFENLIVTAMAQSRIPGISLAVVKDDRVIYAKGFGARNLKDNLPATPNTLYGIGSCTKSFTALAVMQLAEQGKLNVHDPVKKHIPEFKIGKQETPITIYNLLTHSSGIPNLGVAEILIVRAAGFDEKWIPMSSLDDLFLHINGAKEEVAAEPEKRFFYFNEGYTLLGEIVERVSKMKYEDYIRKKILNPLKMNRSTFLKEDFDRDSDVMTAYFVESKDGNITVNPTVHPFHKFVYAPGGLLSSVMELTNYLVANMNGGAFEDIRLLDESLMKEMHKPHVESNIPSLFGKAVYGYGWMVLEDFLGHRLVEHGGSTGVSSASLSFVPDLKIGVALTANMGGAESISVIPSGIMAFLMGKDPMKEIPIFEIERKLGMLAGEYALYKEIHKVSVVNKGGVLYLESKDKLMQMSAPLIPESEKLENFKFYIPGPVKMPVEFVVDSSGKTDLYVERNRLHKIGGQTPTPK